MTRLPLPDLTRCIRVCCLRSCSPFVSAVRTEGGFNFVFVCLESERILPGTEQCPPRVGFTVYGYRLPGNYDTKVPGTGMLYDSVCLRFGFRYCVAVGSQSSSGTACSALWLTRICEYHQEDSGPKYWLVGLWIGVGITTIIVLRGIIVNRTYGIRVTPR